MFEGLLKAVRRFGGPGAEVRIIPDVDGVIVRSEGLHSEGLPEIEIARCPLRLQEVARNLVALVVGHGSKNPEALADGKTVEARFVTPDQPLLEAFQFRLVKSPIPVLRIVDLNGDPEAFPSHFIATHLSATAGNSARDQLRLLLVAIEVWPKEKVASDFPLSDFAFNPNNFWSWIDLGTVLSEAGRVGDAISHWKTGICMWPRGGKFYAARMLAKGASASTVGEGVNAFWSSVSNTAIKFWASELKVEVAEAALAD